jgi:glycosyltransferase involved in cell wall biosynthesis
MDEIKVLIFSSVVPNAQGSGGELLLHRYLTLDPSIRSVVVSWQQFPFRLKLIGKLKQLGFSSVSQLWERLFPVFPRKKMVQDMIQSFQPDILLTVAHGWWHIQARIVARKFNLPLVTFFQDWWPDFPDISAAFRQRIEAQFRKTCAESARAICVSDGMRRELGEPNNALVIYPVPSLRRSDGWRPDFTLPLRIVYFGNLREYGPLIENALRALEGSDQVRLEVFGASPLWTSGSEDYFRFRGLYHEFTPVNQLTDLLQDFQAVLVVMSFDDALRRRMMTSFPSKLIDAMQLGLPIVIWGPDYCSAVEWARRENSALCVTDCNPSALRLALQKLAASPSEQERLAKSSREATAADFNAQRIQAQFMDVLRGAIHSQKISSANPTQRLSNTASAI